jgi:hypothetical protein
MAGKHEDHPDPLFTTFGMRNWKNESGIPMGIVFAFKS